MDSNKENEVATVAITKAKDGGKGKSVKWGAPISTDQSSSSVSTKSAASLPRPPAARWRKGVAIADFVLRLGVIGAAIGAAYLMGNNEEVLPFFTQFLQFHAQWSDFPMFQFLVVAAGVIGGYAVLCLPFSYVCIVRPYALGPRLLLMILDIVSFKVQTCLKKFLELDSSYICWNQLVYTLATACCTY
ncbi:casparian strip membrane protein 5-like [Arachis hypogaea]|uniref:casparian strip membrane protein 5-like n=1 Tax=Arachis hypogaea TaxID=3818 RepID=UPI000DED2098|nr:casparian strip membrane protein 5-like [Arachis hypogaea]